MKITPFVFDDSFPVRTVEKDGAPWFLAVDVCRALGLGNVSMAVEKLDPDERMTISSADSHSGQRGGAQSLLIVSESGLYALVLRCRDAMTPGSVAHRFRKWVTAEVLPTIRATGGYGEACFDEARISRVAGEAAAAAVQAMLPPLLKAHLAETTMHIVDGMSSGEVIEGAGIEGAKGVKGITGMVTRHLEAEHRRLKIPVREKNAGLRWCKAFDPAVVREWLERVGRKLIERRVRESRGQGVLPLKVVK